MCIRSVSFFFLLQIVLRALLLILLLFQVKTILTHQQHQRQMTSCKASALYNVPSNRGKDLRSSVQLPKHTLRKNPEASVWVSFSIQFFFQTNLPFGDLVV